MVGPPNLDIYIEWVRKRVSYSLYLSKTPLDMDVEVSEPLRVQISARETRFGP